MRTTTVEAPTRDPTIIAKAICGPMVPTSRKVRAIAVTGDPLSTR
jgi:hypothetical protein